MLPAGIAGRLNGNGHFWQLGKNGLFGSEHQFGCQSVWHGRAENQGIDPGSFSAQRAADGAVSPSGGKAMLAEEKKISFDRNYAEEVYRKYNEGKSVDDSAVVADLKVQFAGKRILLVAPGKSLKNAMEEIRKLALMEDVISIGLNSTMDIDFDYLLTTRTDIYTQAVADGKNVIAPSSVSKGGRGNVRILNYANWIEAGDQTHDSSAVIATKLLQFCGVREILLAGFDGFSANINDNYYDPNLRRPVAAEQAEKRNSYYKDFFARVRQSGVQVEFVTPSVYA